MLFHSLHCELHLLVLHRQLLSLSIRSFQVSQQLVFARLELFELEDDLLLFFLALLQLGFQLLVHAVDAFFARVALPAVVLGLLELQAQSVQFCVQK